MKQSLTKFFGSLLLVMFVNFMFSNTIFMHVHKDVNGNPITHSHPYIPNSGHTHTGNTINLLSGMNMSALTAVSSASPMLSTPETVLFKLISVSVTYACDNFISTFSLRGPPYKK